MPFAMVFKFLETFIRAPTLYCCHLWFFPNLCLFKALQSFNYIFSKYRPSGPMLSISRNVRLCVSMSVCPYVCPCVHFEVTFKYLFVPTSKSWMSKVFRNLESFRKHDKEKWSQTRKIFLLKDVKLPHKKSFFLGKFCFTEQHFVQTL